MTGRGRSRTGLARSKRRGKRERAAALSKLKRRMPPEHYYAGKQRDDQPHSCAAALPRSIPGDHLASIPAAFCPSALRRWHRIRDAQTVDHGARSRGKREGGRKGHCNVEMKMKDATGTLLCRQADGSQTSLLHSCFSEVNSERPYCESDECFSASMLMLSSNNLRHCTFLPPSERPPQIRTVRAIKLFQDWGEGGFAVKWLQCLQLCFIRLRVFAEVAWNQESGAALGTRSSGGIGYIALHSPSRYLLTNSVIHQSTCSKPPFHG